MFQKLVNHNDDIKRLVDRGYAVGFDSNYLIVRDIPYLDGQRQLQLGAIVTKLEFKDNEHVVQQDHQIFFTGGVPHGLDGQPIRNLGGGTCSLALSDAAKDLVVQRSFSNKPKASGKFADFFEKIESYVTIISGPAMELYGADPYTFRVADGEAPESVFKFHDTLTSRAEIVDLAAKFKDEVVAIIGLGGTGGYLLDFMVKTPVREVRAFDADVFHIHNAFRSPGRVNEDEFKKSKAEVYAARYGNFRHGLSILPKFIDASSVEDLEGVTFAFVCVDRGSSRAEILDLLIARGIPFIDVGMGLKRRDGLLTGMMRVTYFSAENGTAVRDKGLVELKDRPDDLYRTNIQIAELNALNAALAVIRFKQLRGFYFSEQDYFHLLFDVADMKTAGETPGDEN